MSSPQTPKPASARKASRPRTPLSRERILRVAVELADRQGIEALSMRRLAQELGVEAMSLYNHVSHKEDLLDGMIDLVASEIELPLIGPNWREAMRRRCRSAHAMLLRHPWACQLTVARLNVGPAMLRYVDATIGCLVEAGFSYPQADWAWNTLDSHVYGFTLQYLNFPLAPEEYASTAAGFLPQLPPDDYPYLKAMAQLVIQGEHSGQQDFDFGLELLLEGLARMLPDKA